MARPSKFSDKLALNICEKLSIGKSLRSICIPSDMPNARTVHRWLHTHEEFCQQYTRAREIQADTIFDECLDIADENIDDIITIDGREQTNHDVIARAKLKIDTRKWMAGKLRPKVYGDKLKLDHESPDGSMTPQATIYQLPDNGRT